MKIMKRLKYKSQIMIVIKHLSHQIVNMKEIAIKVKN